MSPGVGRLGAVRELVREAARHLDATEGVMRPGHMVTGDDVAAIRTVLAELARLGALERESLPQWRCPECGAMVYGDTHRDPYGPAPDCPYCQQAMVPDVLSGPAGHIQRGLRYILSWYAGR